LFFSLGFAESPLNIQESEHQGRQEEIWGEIQAEKEIDRRRANIDTTDITIHIETYEIKKIESDSRGN
jgi:hypothetical protein